MKPLFLLILLLVLAAPVSATCLNLTETVGDTYATWSWDAGTNMSSISLDMVEQCGYESTYNVYSKGGFPPNSVHFINLTTDGGITCNSTITTGSSPAAGSSSAYYPQQPISPLIPLAGIVICVVLFIRKRR